MGEGAEAEQGRRARAASGVRGPRKGGRATTGRSVRNGEDVGWSIVNCFCTVAVCARATRRVLTSAGGIRGMLADVGAERRETECASSTHTFSTVGDCRANLSFLCFFLSLSCLDSESLPLSLIPTVSHRQPCLASSKLLETPTQIQNPPPRKSS